MDGSVSQLFDENKDYMRIIEGIEVRINDMMDIEPRVTSMQHEMNNLIFNLPRGEYSMSRLYFSLFSVLNLYKKNTCIQ